MKTALIETLNPTPDVINAIYDDMKKVMKSDYSELDYGTNSNGMVFYFQEPGKDDATKSKNLGVIVLSNSDLAKLRARVISRQDTSDLLQSYYRQKFDFGEYNEDLYTRLCSLFTSSVRRALYKNPVDCDHDSDHGITLTINVNNIEQQVVFTVAQIKSHGGQDTRPALNAMDKEFKDRLVVMDASKPERK